MAAEPTPTEETRAGAPPHMEHPYEPTAPPPGPEEAPLHEGEEPPPPGVGVMAVVRWLLLLALTALAVWSFVTLLAPRGGRGQQYTCPMVEHAFVVTDEPGECPLCHMQLMPLDPALIEARRQEAEADRASAGPAVSGVMPIAVHLDRAQKMGVRSVEVVEAEIDEQVRSPAYVASPEQGESRVHARAAGYIERVAVGEVGASVSAGQPMVYLYSPEVYRAQEEYLLARRWREGGGGAAVGSPVVEAARRRLELLGVSAHDLAEIERKDAPVRALPVRAPAAGVVSRKEIALGAYVTPEMMLYEVIDLSRAYLVADVLASQSGRLKAGTPGTATFAGQAWAVAIDLVYPAINAAARTTRLRLRFTGARPPLRPGLYGEVAFALGRHRARLVPRDAVLDTGAQRYVFLDQGDGKYAPRAVVVGDSTGEQVEIREGVAAGDRVVSGATFLIDAESRLQAAFSGALAPGSSAAPAASPSAPRSP